MYTTTPKVQTVVIKTSILQFLLMVRLKVSTEYET